MRYPKKSRRKRVRSPLRGRGRGGLLVGLVLLGLFVADRGDMERVLAFLLDEAGVTTVQTGGSSAREADFSGRVTRIVDGDTFWISGQEERIRIWGLDAPEVREAAGSAATAALTRLIAGQTLQCRQRDTDRYDRIVGQCWLPDGRDITAAMIASGTASEYCRFSGNHYGTC